MGEIFVTGSFPGGNPQAERRIEGKSRNTFLVFPECESNETPAYKFRMDIDVINKSDSAEQVRILIDWQEPLYMHLRVGIYARGPDKLAWQYLNGIFTEQKGLVLYELFVLPGTTNLSAQPRYDDADLKSLAELCRKTDITVVQQSEGNIKYPIVSFEIKDSEKDKPAILVVARIHPYESAGSYCVDGIIRTFCRNKQLCNKIAGKYNIILIPLLSVEGVMRGFCRLNGTDGGGIDLGREWKRDDPICLCIKNICYRNNIVGYLEIHNWMHAGFDGVKFMNLFKTIQFVHTLKGLNARNKKWKKFLKYGLFAEKHRGVKLAVKELSGAQCLMVEYPWYERNVSDLYELGVQTLMAFSHILV